MDIDILCPLYNAEKDFDVLMQGINSQINVNIKNIVFPVTESFDKTYDLACKVKNAKVIKVLKKDFSHSFTREKCVFELCESDIVVFLTQDVVLSSNDALEKLVDCINDEVIHAFSKQITKSKGIEKYTREKNFPNSSYVVSKDDIEKMQIKAFYSSDACAAYNRKKFLELGGFDGKTFQVSEDMYYCRKALLSGYKIMYCAESVVTHSHNLTLKNLYKRYYDIGVFFGQNPEFLKYKSSGAGLSLAFYIFRKALVRFDIKTLFRLIPDMIARFIGKRKGQKVFLKRKI